MNKRRMQNMFVTCALLGPMVMLIIAAITLIVTAGQH